MKGILERKEWRKNGKGEKEGKKKRRKEEKVERGKRRKEEKWEKRKCGQGGKSKYEEKNYPFILDARRVNASVTLRLSLALVLM
mgnify:FL=1